MSATTKSTTSCLTPILGSLIAAEEIIGPRRKWRPVNDSQREFIREYLADLEAIRTLPELESLASYDANELNRFLADRGFSIRLPKLEDPDFGVASVFELLVEWLDRGEQAKVYHDSISYPAIRIESGFTVLTPINTAYPIAKLETKSRDEVFIKIHPDAPEDFIDQERQINLCLHSQPDRQYRSITFPMVDLGQEEDISWIKGLETRDTGGQAAVVAQALQQTKFRMNEIGAKVESAVAIHMQRMVSFADPNGKHLTIDKPFLLWIRRTGFEKPIFSGWFAPDSWKQPAQL